MKAAEFAALIVPLLEKRPDATVYLGVGYDTTGQIVSVQLDEFADGTASITIVGEP